MKSSDANAIIRLTDVHKTYVMGDVRVHALAGVTMTFRHGEFWAIMGASGSGKSTMLNLLGCLDRPTKGLYLFEEQDISLLDDDGLSEIRLRRIGFVFQSFHLIPQLTVRENIELPLYYMGIDANESSLRAEALAERVGLADRLRHKPKELSGGQQQRVAIARALANEPKILLADEPTGNLDSRTGDQIMELLGELNRSGTMVIMVTHEPVVAAHARQRLVMRDGRVAEMEGGGHA